MSNLELWNEELSDSFKIFNTTLSLTHAHPAGIFRPVHYWSNNFRMLFRNDAIYDKYKNKIAQFQETSTNNENKFSRSFAKLVVGQYKLTPDSNQFLPVLLRPIVIESEKITLSKETFLSDNIIQVLKTHSVAIKQEVIQKEVLNNAIPSNLFNNLYKILVKHYPNILFNKNLSFEFWVKRFELPKLDEEIYGSIFYKLVNGSDGNDESENLNIFPSGEVIKELPNKNAPIDINYERGIGNLNKSQNYILNTASLGTSFLMFADTEKLLQDTVAGIATDFAASNKSVALLIKNEKIKKNIVKSVNEAGVSVIDAYGTLSAGHINEIPKKEMIRQIRSALVKTKENIRSYFSTILQPSDEWSFPLIDAFAKVNAYNNSQFDSVGDFRFDTNVLHKIDSAGLNNILENIQLFLERRYYNEKSSIWDNSKINSDEVFANAKNALEKVQTITDDIEKIANELLEAGYIDISNKSMGQIKEIIDIASKINDYLDRLKPEIFEKNITAFINAFDTKNVKMKWLQRRRMKKAFKDFYIPGVNKGVEPLQELNQLKNFKDLWLKFSSSNVAPTKISRSSLQLFYDDYEAINVLKELFDNSFDFLELKPNELCEKIKSLQTQKIDIEKNKVLKSISEFEIDTYFQYLNRKMNIDSVNKNNDIMANFEYLFYKNVIRTTYLLNKNLSLDIGQAVSNYTKLLNANLAIKKALIFNAVNNNKQVVQLIGLGQKSEFYKTTEFDLVILDKINSVAEFLYLTQKAKQVILINSPLKLDLPALKIEVSANELENWKRLISELKLREFSSQLEL